MVLQHDFRQFQSEPNSPPHEGIGAVPAYVINKNGKSLNSRWPVPSISNIFDYRLKRARKEMHEGSGGFVLFQSDLQSMLYRERKLIR